MRPVQSHLNKSLETVDENLSIEEEQLPINPLSIRIEDKELTEEQLRRKYPFSYGQVSAKGTGIEGAKEGLTQAVDLATDVAPFIGTAKAATELPEDARFAKQLIDCLLYTSDAADE